MLELAQVNRLQWLIRLELLGLMLIPRLAAMMAWGIGSNWV
jgi:uncharacterized membrane protein